MTMANRVLPKDNPLVCANTQFAIDTLRLVASSLNPSDNMFFSPFSISTALAMTSLGARGNTLTEMKTGLRFAADHLDDSLHSGFNDVIGEINAPGSPYTLQTANRIYTKLGKDFCQQFLDATRKHYSAEAKAVDFRGNPSGVKQEINQWVEEQTANKIKDLIPDIDPMTAMILVNAIYFKGNWADKFDPKHTQKKPFQINANEKVDTDFMFQKKSYHYGENEELKCKVVGMPYEGQHLSFFIFVPNDVEGLQHLMDNITQDHFTDIFRKFTLSKVEVNVFLPKFKMEQSIGLNKVLGDLGMRDMFSAQRADFSGMDGSKEMYVSDVIHKAFIDVNEEGTEAAAATAVMMRCCCAMRTLRVVADRPFMYMIRDNRNGSILFMGRYCQPPKEQ